MKEHEIKCALCGKTFYSLIRKKCCSEICKKEYKRIYQNNYQRCYQRDTYDVSGLRKCKECGEEFNISSGQRKYCSEECRKNHKYKAKEKPQAEQTIDDISKLAKAQGKSYGQYMLERYLAEQARKEKENK